MLRAIVVVGSVVLGASAVVAQQDSVKEVQVLMKGNGKNVGSVLTPMAKGEKPYDQAAVDAMRRELNRLPIEGQIVIGEGERDEAPMLFIGEKVGAALVGTFLGILMCYGFLAPLASSLEQRINEDAHFEQCIKAGIHAMYKGFPPIVAIEFARRVLPDEIRPSFEETEKIVKGAPAEAAA